MSKKKTKVTKKKVVAITKVNTKAKFQFDCKHIAELAVIEMSDKIDTEFDAAFSEVASAFELIIDRYGHLEILIELPTAEGHGTKEGVEYIGMIMKLLEGALWKKVRGDIEDRVQSKFEENLVYLLADTGPMLKRVLDV